MSTYQCALPQLRKGTDLATKLDHYSIPEPNTGCVLWLASLYWNGYGVVSHEGKNKKAHRVNYELHHGPVPAGMVLDHTCSVRSCINIDHLEVVTQKVNVHRGRRMDLQEFCNRGHEYTPENTATYTRTDGRTLRQCVTCSRLRAANARELARAS